MGRSVSLQASDVDEGEMGQVDADGVVVAVANVEGSFYAFQDACTHQGCPLSDGELDGTVVSCPCHGSRFDVTTGAVLEGPATEPLATYRVATDGDNVTVQV